MRYGAVIIETRKLDFQQIVNRHLSFLPKTWEWCVIDEYPIDSMMDYNMLLTSAPFWERIPFDKVLIFQHDSGLLRPGIEEFLEYDYVGAPWKFQDHGGNGGLSLRSKAAMLGVINNVPYQHILHGNEDVFYSNHLERCGYKMAPREVCKKFSVESIFELGTLGYHAPNKHLTHSQTQQILNQYNK